MGPCMLLGDDTDVSSITMISPGRRRKGLPLIWGSTLSPGKCNGESNMVGFGMSLVSSIIVLVGEGWDRGTSLSAAGGLGPRGGVEDGMVGSRETTELDSEWT